MIRRVRILCCSLAPETGRLICSMGWKTLSVLFSAVSNRGVGLVPFSEDKILLFYPFHGVIPMASS